MTEEEKRNQVNITKTILSQIFSFNENLFEELNVRSVSPMTEGKHQRGGAIIHLPNDAKIEIRLTWVDLYHVKYYTNVESNMVIQDNGKINYEASGNCVYDLDGCYFDMLADVIEKAVTCHDEDYPMILGDDDDNKKTKDDSNPLNFDEPFSLN